PGRPDPEPVDTTLLRIDDQQLVYPVSSIETELLPSVVIRGDDLHHELRARQVRSAAPGAGQTSVGNPVVARIPDIDPADHRLESARAREGIQDHRQPLTQPLMLIAPRR